MMPPDGFGSGSGGGGDDDGFTFWLAVIWIAAIVWIVFFK